MEQIVVGLRRPHSESPSRREHFTTVLSEGRRRGVFRLPSRSPRLRAANHLLFGSVGGRHHGGLRVSELDVARGKSAVWNLNGTLGPGSIGFPSVFPEDC